MTWDERIRETQEQIVNVEALLASHLEHITETRRGEESGDRALALDDRVGRERRAVDDRADVARRDTRLREQLACALDDRATRLIGRREDLVDGDDARIAV